MFRVVRHLRSEKVFKSINTVLEITVHYASLLLQLVPVGMVVLIDGGFSTQLSTHVGNRMDGHPLWCAQFLASDPQAVVNTHRDYIRAGADIITTNSYQATVDGFEKYLGLDKQSCIELIKTSVTLAREAIDAEHTIRHKKVAGSVGPYGAYLTDGSEYDGSYCNEMSTAELAAWHQPRIAALVEAGVDLIALETIPALQEAEVLLSLLKLFPNTKAWLTFSCKDDAHLANGELFSRAVIRCLELNADQLVAIGVNCIHPSLVSPLLRSAGDSHPIPFIVYSNSGEVWDASEKRWTGKEECVPLVHYLTDWLDLGVNYVGGCCRTDAADIVGMRAYIDAHQ